MYQCSLWLVFGLLPAVADRVLQFVDDVAAMSGGGAEYGRLVVRELDIGLPARSVGGNRSGPARPLADQALGRRPSPEQVADDVADVPVTHDIASSAVTGGPPAPGQCPSFARHAGSGTRAARGAVGTACGASCQHSTSPSRTAGTQPVGDLVELLPVVRPVEIWIPAGSFMRR